MSTRGSIQFASVGSHRNHTEFAWHLYHETLDDTIRLEITAFSFTVLNVPAEWLYTLFYGQRRRSA